METRAHKDRIDRVRRRLKFNFSYCVEARRTAGGLALFWSDMVQIQVCSASPNFLHCVVVDKEKQRDFDCSFVYGHPVRQQRRQLWGALANFQNNHDRAWCSMGDYNEILAQYEKGARPQNQQGMEAFKNFLDETRLM